MTRVCVLTSVHRPDDHRLRKECRSLLGAGFEVAMVAPWHRNDTIDDIPVHAVPVPAHRSDRMTRTVWEVYRAGLAQHADIYHLHDPELLPIGLLLKIRGRDVIYDAHEDVPRDI